MMFTTLYVIICVLLIILSCFCDHVVCNSNNSTGLSNIHYLRQRRASLQSSRDDEGHYMKYEDLFIHHYPTARPLMLKIKALYEIGEHSPDELINILSNDDPFGVSRLTNPHEFVCNKSERFPYRVDNEKLKKFRNNEAGYYIFFQHIRKAGGTTMCALAQENLLPNQTSPKYCFLDKYTGSLTSYPYNDADFFEFQMQERGFRYVPNEASPFDDVFFSYPGAIFITMFREPMDRWYSQYRFDYLEGRYMSSSERIDFTATPIPHKLSFIQWYNAHKSQFTCPNVYTNAFIGQSLVEKYTIDRMINRDHSKRLGSKSFWGYIERANIPMNHRNFIRAIDNLLRFSMIFILEWLNDEASSQAMIKELLGWKKTVEHVLPQQNVVKREDTHSRDSLTDVKHEDYMLIAKENVFDLLFYQIAKRIFLERLKCHEI